MGFFLRYQSHDFELSEGRFLIGRSPECQLSLDDPLVSRAHAALIVSRDGATLEDLGSRNGVRVNEHRIQGARTLVPGDELAIGSQRLVFGLEPQSARGATLDARASRESALSVLAELADKAILLGRGEEAERLLGGALTGFMRTVTPVTSADSLERTALRALKLAAATGRARWVDWVVELYERAERTCPSSVVDELYAVMSRVGSVDLARLRAYVARERAREGLGPAERFLVGRLDGLERVAAVK